MEYTCLGSRARDRSFGNGSRPLLRSTTCTVTTIPATSTSTSPLTSWSSWSSAWNILSHRRSIGRPCGIFSVVVVVLLVARMEYSSTSTSPARGVRVVV
eukprot:2995937-Pyramimonas_sp.AAC.1